MATDSKSTSGFWLKVIFWLVIIILGFMYIRSLAINPKSEDSGAVLEQEAKEISTTAKTTTTGEATGEADSSAITTAEDESGVSEETAQQGGIESGYSVSAPEQVIRVDSAPAEAVASSTEAEQAADTASTIEEPVTAPKASSSTSDEMQSLRDMHAESVSKILKEFDDLRNATRAEIEAMRNRIQAERELREAMTPPPAWSRQGYSPYGGYPPPQQGYQPYYGR